MNGDDGFLSWVWEIIREHPIRSPLVLLGVVEGVRWLFADWSAFGAFMGIGYAFAAMSFIAAVVSPRDMYSIDASDIWSIFSRTTLVLHGIAAVLVIFSAFYYRHPLDQKWNQARAEIFSALFAVDTAGPPTPGMDVSTLQRDGTLACALQPAQDEMGILNNVSPFVFADFLPFAPFFSRLVGMQPVPPVDHCVLAYRRMRAAFPAYEKILDQKYPFLLPPNAS